MTRLATLLANARSHPVAVALELGTVLGCVLLFVATMLALTGGQPAASEGLWIAIVAGGASVVVLWTFLVPLYERYRP